MRLFNVLAALALATGSGSAAAQEVWSGRDVFFQKADYADHTLPQNQDRISDAVRLTRADAQGIFNIAQEGAYIAFVSPADTEWATGDAADWQSLTFQPWQAWNQGYPPGMVGLDAVVHLVSEDIYVDIRFESWTAGGLGGGFSYYRAGPAPISTEAATWGRIKGLYR
jgi:hypothetical protein